MASGTGMNVELAISVKGFEGFAEMPEITVSPGINLLVGRNNVGKSRLLNFIFGLKDRKGI